MAKKPVLGLADPNPSRFGGADPGSRTAQGGIHMPGGLIRGSAVGRDLYEFHEHHHYHPAPTPRGAGRPPLEEYITWLQGQPSGLCLVGVAGRDMHLELDAVYVPLRLADGSGDRPTGAGGRRGRNPGEQDRDTFDLPELLARVPDHALLLGGVGSGKTTALRKLVQLCLPPLRPVRCRGAGAGAAPGAGAPLRGYLPIFAPLYRFTRADLDRSLADFLHDALLVAAKGQLHAATITALLGHPHLLVLLDGLDEVADETLRADVCAHLGRELAGDACRDWRVVVTSRSAGYRRDAVRLDEARFAHVELQPLGPKQVPRLVRRWFDEAARHPANNYSRRRATRDANQLIETLTDATFDRELRVMFATPLFLTLLCVVVQQARETPRSRAKFYDECLRVLLERRQATSVGAAAPRRVGRGTAAEPVPEPPDLDAETAIDLLRSIAYELHRHETRDALSTDVLVLEIDRRLRTLRRSEDADEVLRWLIARTGVIVEFGEGSGKFGFIHLSVQEYLAALHIAREGLLDPLVHEFHKSWWHEVARLVVSIGGKRTFRELFERLLDPAHVLDPKRHEVLRRVFTEAREVDLRPVLARLERPELPAEYLLALLRLVQGARDRALAALARRLALQTDDERLRATADRTAVEATGGGTTASNVAVLAHAADVAAGGALVEHLRRRGLSVWPGPGGFRTLESLDRRRLVKEAQVAALVIGSEPWWLTDDMAARIELIERGGVRLVGVRAPGAQPLAAAPPVPLAVDCSGGWQHDELASLCRALCPVPAELVEGQRYVEPITNMTLVWVPGGEFTMGSDELGEPSGPAHRVRVSPYWIGETPVTNRQYEVFVHDTGHRKPRGWDRPDASDPEQPVVTVSWDDASAFCAWLGGKLGLQVALPSEAQWEFAARGPDGRRYPWGDEAPDATRACFAQTRPARVASHARGKGPFGTFDQAGNVLEWCRDVWDRTLYAERARQQGVPVDPVGEAGGENYHPLRGGSFLETAEDAARTLAAANRVKGWLVSGTVVGLLGFRVVVVPPRRPAQVAADPEMWTFFGQHTLP